MNAKRYAAFAILLTAILILCSCGGKSGQIDAVVDAIAGYTDHFIMADDVAGQLRRQSRGATGYEAEAGYTLDIRIPDYSMIDINAIPYDVPAVDYANADHENYLAEVRDAIRRSAELYAMTADLGAYVPSQMTVELTKEDGAWTAEISPRSKLDIQALVESMIEAKAAELAAWPKECEFVRIAEQKDALFGSLIDGGSYYDAIAVTGVDELDGGRYRLHVSYPDPAVMFGVLKDRFIGSYSERHFGSIDCRFDPADYGMAARQAAQKSGSIVVSADTSGRFFVSDGQAFKKEFDGARTNAEASAGRIVNERWSVPEVDPPASHTLLCGENKGSAHFVVTLSEQAPASYIRMMKVEESIEETGTLEAGFYVLSNKKSFKVNFPPGKYKVLIAWGDTWYGPEYMFGPDGHYAYFNEVTVISSGYTWTWYNVDSGWYTYKEIERYRYDVDTTV